jgi:NAD-dependent dihydropyrimidine dehydrogenase PreA subunit
MYKTEINYGPKIDYQHCKGCGECYKNCPMDVFGWDEDNQMPTVAYGAECSCCCFCEVMCPEVAIDVHLPLQQMLDFGIEPVALKKEYGILNKRMK